MSALAEPPPAIERGDHRAAQQRRLGRERPHFELLVGLRALPAWNAANLQRANAASLPSPRPSPASGWVSSRRRSASSIASATAPSWRWRPSARSTARAASRRTSAGANPIAPR